MSSAIPLRRSHCWLPLHGECSNLQASYALSEEGKLFEFAKISPWFPATAKTQDYPKVMQNIQMSCGDSPHSPFLTLVFTR